MKTTVDIPDMLLKEARKVALREGTTVRALIQQGLRRVLAERKQSKAFRLRKATFKGKGLHPRAAGASWDQLRSLIYEGRGGG